jgi:hypothetical protein
MNCACANCDEKSSVARIRTDAANNIDDISMNLAKPVRSSEPVAAPVAPMQQKSGS